MTATSAGASSGSAVRRAAFIHVHARSRHQTRVTEKGLRARLLLARCLAAPAKRTHCLVYSHVRED
jgi:hypothetical protein